MSIRDTLLALLVILIFGTNFAAMKWALNEIPPILFVGLRFLMVLLPAVFFVAPPRHSILKIGAIGLFIGAIQFGFLFEALRADITTGLASLLLQIQVPSTILLSVLFLGESVRVRQIIGILLAAVGFLLFLQNEGGNVTLIGVALVTIAALSWACGNLVIKTMGKVNMLQIMVWSSLVPASLMITLSAFLETPNAVTVLRELSVMAWLSTAFVAYVSTIVGYSLWGFLLQRYNAATVTPFALLIPIIGMATGALVFNESLNFIELVGTVLVLAGLAFCVLRFPFAIKK